MNIREFLEDRVNKNPEKVYLYFQDQEVTYKDFNNWVNKTANSFWELGVRKGDNIAIMLPNRPEFLYTWFGLNKIGAVEVLVNFALKEQALQYLLSNSEARGIVIHADCYPVLENIRANLPSLKHVILVGGEAPAGTIPYKNWIADAPTELRSIPISEEDVAVIIYTGGTTGSPKGVQHSHLNWILTGESYAYTAGFSSDDRVMTSNPLFHTNAQVYSTMGSLAAYASLILLEKFSASLLWERARLYGATKLVLVGPVTSWVWSQPPQEDDGDNPVKTVLAAFFPEGHYYDFEKRFNVKVQTIFSLTEVPLAIMAPREGTRPMNPEGVGIVMEHPDPSFKTEAKIVDKQDREVPRGQDGEIIIRNPAVMLGYYKNPEKTAEIIRDGWVHTGDRGRQDEDGYFYFVGRIKETIRRRAEFIPPDEVEAVINKHPKVLDSAVIGVDSGLGVGEEEIKAYVALKPGESATPQEIVNWCSDNLADFKVPRYLEFRTDFPRSAIGKIQRSVLKTEKKDLTEGCYDREKKGKT